jgi:hypothetical protein
MPPELVALIDKPILLAAVLAVGAVIGIAVERLVEGQKRAERRAYWAGRKSAGKPGLTAKGQPQPVDLAAEQLRKVMGASFTARALLNRGEQRLIATIDRALAEHSPGWRAFAQVSLGEIVASPDTAAYFAVNSKRVDLLIVDAQCRPLHAIEFQGQGHHAGDTAAARDAVKKEALRRAGIGYVEVVSGDTPAEVRGMVRKLVGRKAA